MRIATDIGGTFTDLVYLDEQTGAVGTTKVSTTPASFDRGVIEAVQRSSQEVRATQFFVHGTTVVINALTERKGVKTGLITTQGFRDVLEIGRANRPDIYNMAYAKPVPFVPRHLRLEVRGRLNYRGEELEPLNQSDVAEAVGRLCEENVEAVAVCLLHSYANAAHELACGEVIKRLAPGMPVTLSHQITQEWREFERSSTAVLNSYVHPIARGYLEKLEQSLQAMQIPRQSLYVMQSNGGSATFQTAWDTPISLVESGPVAGVIGAAVIGKLSDEPNVIALDIGGTTAKTSLIEASIPRITTGYKIEHRRDFAGYPILVPTIDIVEIGAGGGSIAWIDTAGALHVGPVSAGADPGPACYGKGGTQATVTDANVLAGRINPDYFLGGEIPLDIEKARSAIQPIADTFNIGVEEAAMGIIRLADANMMNALKLVSIRRGYDPRDFVLVAFGGGGAMHGAALARELRAKKVIIPNLPGVFSAWGMLMADLRRDLIRTQVTRTDQAAPLHLDSIFLEMEQQAQQAITDEGIASADVIIQRHADMRYLGQEHTVKVPIRQGTITAASIVEINARFHRLHEQTYTFRLDNPTELVNYHVTAFGRVKTPEIRKLTGDGMSLEHAKKGNRLVNFDELGLHETMILERERIPLNTSIRGPLVVEEPASTTVVFPDQTLTRDAYGFLHIELAV